MKETPLKAHPCKFGDGSLTATLEPREDALWITLQGEDYAPRTVRLLRLEVHSKMVRRIETVERYRVESCEVNGSSAWVFVSEPSRSVAVGLHLSISNGELSVVLNPGEVYEDNAELYRLFAIQILPGLMCSDESLLLPITCGVLAEMAGKPRLSDRFLIYGEQERWELLPLLPVCAAFSQELGGMMALAARGAAETACLVKTDGSGNGQVDFAFSLRCHWRDPVAWEQREFRYLPIPPRQAVLMFVAARLRRHIQRDLGKETLQQRMEESPEVAYLQGAYIMKLFHASPRSSGLFEQIMRPKRDGMASLPLDVWMSFAEAEEALRRVRAAGIDKVLTQSVGWNPRGHDGLYPTRMPPEARVGGAAGLSKLMQSGRAMSYAMSLHDNYMDAYRASPHFDLETTIQDVYGEPLVAGEWGGGINYRQWPLAMGEDRLRGEMSRIRDMGVSGMYYLDAMGVPLEVNYHPRHGGSRSDHERGVVHTLKVAREVFGSVGTENGFLYVALDADCLVSSFMERDRKAKLPAEWPIAALCDRQVPLWHLALHGLVFHEGHGQGPQDIMLKVLFGSLPRTEWSARPGMFPVPDDRMIRALMADYEITCGQFGRLQTQAITHYCEPAVGVEETCFEDGTRVQADFVNDVLLVDGKSVPLPSK